MDLPSANPETHLLSALGFATALLFMSASNSSKLTNPSPFASASAAASQAIPGLDSVVGLLSRAEMRMQALCTYICMSTCQVHEGFCFSCVHIQLSEHVMEVLCKQKRSFGERCIAARQQHQLRNTLPMACACAMQARQGGMAAARTLGDPAVRVCVNEVEGGTQLGVRQHGLVRSR